MVDTKGETNMFTIQRGGQSFPFERSKFLLMFPQSMIASVLQNDSTVETIELEEKSVTPRILEYLQNVVLFDEVFATPDLASPRSEPLIQAGRYLGIDLFEVVANPKYDDLINRYHVNLVDLNNITSKTNYIKMMIYAVTNDYPELVRYLFARTVPEQYLDQDQKLLSIAILQNNASLVKLFLRRGVNPSQSFLSQNEVKKLALTYPKDVPAYSGIQPLYFALNVASDEIVLALLESGKLELNNGGEEALRLALRRERPDIATLLLAYQFPVTNDQTLVDFITKFPNLLPDVLQNPDIKSDAIMRTILRLMNSVDMAPYLDALTQHSRANEQAKALYRLYSAVVTKDYDLIPVAGLDPAIEPLLWDMRSQIMKLVDEMKDPRLSEAVNERTIGDIFRYPIVPANMVANNPNPMNTRGLARLRALGITPEQMAERAFNEPESPMDDAELEMIARGQMQTDRFLTPQELQRMKELGLME